MLDETSISLVGNMQFYVINLDRAVDRWLHIQNQFKKFGLTPTRISAIDGNHLTTEDDLLYRRGRYRDLYDGEIGCFLSHRKCWQLIANGQDDYAFVFEDDIYLSNLFPHFVNSKMWVGAYDLISIEQFRTELYVRPGSLLKHDDFSIYEVVHDNPGTGGYIISKKIARILLSHSNPFHHLVDSFMFSPRRNFPAQFGSYQLNPAVCIQGYKNKEFAQTHYSYPSSIGNNKKLALSSPHLNKDLNYYVYRLRNYTRLWMKNIRRKKIKIDFTE